MDATTFPCKVPKTWASWIPDPLARPGLGPKNQRKIAQRNGRCAGYLIRPSLVSLGKMPRRHRLNARRIRIRRGLRARQQCRFRPMRVNFESLSGRHCSRKCGARGVLSHAAGKSDVIITARLHKRVSLTLPKAWIIIAANKPLEAEISTKIHRPIPGNRLRPLFQFHPRTTRPFEDYNLHPL